VIKTGIFSLQVGFTDDFVPDCPFKVVFLAVQTLILLFSLTVPNFVVFFLCCLVVNLMRIPQLYLKQ